MKSVTLKYIFSVIDDLKNEWYKPPSGYYHRKRIDFKQRAYSKSAIDEIRFYLMEHEEEDPIIAIENFRNMVDSFACDAKNSETKFMFSVYYDVASHVLDILLGLR